MPFDPNQLRDEHGRWTDTGVGDIVDIDAKDIVASKSSFDKANSDVAKGRGSKTTGPLDIHVNEKGEPILTDGYHRLAEGLAKGNRTYQAKVVSKGYSDYWATPHKDDRLNANDEIAPVDSDALSPEVTAAMVARIRAGDERSKNKGRPGGPETVTEPHIIASVPLSSIPQSVIDHLKESTNSDRVDDYAKIPGNMMPPVFLFPRRSGDGLGVSDGGHRILAAIQRGDTHVNAIIPATERPAREFTSDQGYEWHESEPVREWIKALPYDDASTLTNYASFGYSDLNQYLRGKFKPRMIDQIVRPATAEEIASYKSVLKSHPGDYKDDDPTNKVADGRIVHNVFASHEWSIQRQVPDTNYVEGLKKTADQINDTIANRGFVLPEKMQVLRGIYLAGISEDDLKAKVGKEWIEQGFTSTMLGDAQGRFKSYASQSKFESLYKRHGSIAKHQDEVGTAVNFIIDLPAGTKVASVEAARRMRYDWQRKTDLPKDHEEYGTRDKSKPPTPDDKGLSNKSERSESEILLGSGAHFRIKSVKPGKTIEYKDDPTIKPIKHVDVHMEYVGGGSSDGNAVKKFAEWDEDLHPRGDDGRFVSSGDIAAAKSNPAKADALRERVTNPVEREKLDAAIGKSVTDSPKFKAWFGKSAVVDRAGKPVVMYHGSGSDHESFQGGTFFTDSAPDAVAYGQLKALESAIEGNDELGDIISEIMSDEQAESMTDLGVDRLRDIIDANGFDVPKADDSVTKAVYLSVQNPLDLTDLGSSVGDPKEMWNDLHDKGFLDEPWDDLDEEAQREINDDYNGMAAYRFFEKEGIYAKAFEKGYDGVKFVDQSLDGGSTHTSWIIKKPTQAKSIDNVEFDPKDDRINFAEWDESEHPRNKDGEFDYKEGGGSEPKRLGVGRSKNDIVFSKPIIGPSGAKLTAYEWKYMVEDVETEDDVVGRRVSDWDQAQTNQQTGRDVVHHFTVETPDGKAHVVSLESATKMLGYARGDSSDGVKAIKSLTSTLKTRAKLQMQLDQTKAFQKRMTEVFDKIEKEVDALPVPPIEKRPSDTPGSEREWWSMGGIEIPARINPSDRADHDRERRQTLTEEWKSAQVAKRIPDDVKAEFKRTGWRGWRYSVGANIKDLENRIKRADKKIDTAVKAQSKPESFTETYTGWMQATDRSPKSFAGLTRSVPTVEAVIAKSIANGRNVLTRIYKDALLRVNGVVNRRLFTNQELAQLAETIAETRATAELIGRSRVRARQAQIESGVRKFSEHSWQHPWPTPWRLAHVFYCRHQGKKNGQLIKNRPIIFAEQEKTPTLLAPERAIEYFRALTPSLDPLPAFADRIGRESFTLAVATEEKLLTDVQDAISKAIAEGKSAQFGAARIRQLLTESEISPANPQYAEMVYRTNAMDSYTKGISLEMQNPDVINDIPVWRYDGILDGRQGEDHEPHFGLYYSVLVPFEIVRGPRVFNCRCVPTPIDITEWRELQDAGYEMETEW